eukprot:1139045-Prymnesium_polylepis.1
MSGFHFGPLVDLVHAPASIQGPQVRTGQPFLTASLPGRHVPRPANTQNGQPRLEIRRNRRGIGCRGLETGLETA